MATGINLRGADELMKQFELFDTPYFAIYQGKDLQFYYDNDNIDGARELLQQQLDVLSHNRSTATFKAVFYTDLNDKGKLTPDNIKGTTTFRVCSPGVSYNHPEFIGSYGDRRGNTRLRDEQDQLIEELKEKVETLEARLNDEQDNEPQAVGGIQGFIGAFLNNEQVQAALLPRLFGLIDQILPAPKPAAQPAAINGIADETEVQAAIRRLFEAGMNIDDLIKLSNIPKNNPALFSILLTQLRAQ